MWYSATIHHIDNSRSYTFKWYLLYRLLFSFNKFLMDKYCDIFTFVSATVFERKSLKILSNINFNLLTKEYLYGYFKNHFRNHSPATWSIFRSWINRGFLAEYFVDNSWIYSRYYSCNMGHY
jgi:hypothetical protein